MGKKNRAAAITAIGLMAALVFIFTNFRIKFPTPLGQSMVHLGNIMCLLAGLLFGALPGGLAAGIGSALFDLTSEYAAEAWITGINKFFMGYVCGKVAVPKNGEGGWKRNVLAVVLGTVTYQILWHAKNIINSRFILGVEWPVVWADVAAKAIPSLLNTPFNMLAAVLLAKALIPALKRSGYLAKVRSAFAKDEPAAQ